ncbi:DUF4114 domain-containing protein [Ruegeria sp. SCSIO 43209]|uniref:DUF4114 domain-containing protein n=1 Tax=Ruegeria sp. SCSIO 43209 TaxID=2793010 RepID=UPI001CA93C01|nr:DUF4114 domain-containing protein [Ruegeria sp. SCSIO 43209]UAB88259.1 DUF4114 domain-containing protein [Ruegeria sp. SCSIO 43209]
MATYFDYKDQIVSVCLRQECVGCEVSNWIKIEYSFESVTYQKIEVFDDQTGELISSTGWDGELISELVPIDYNGQTFFTPFQEIRYANGTGLSGFSPEELPYSDRVVNAGLFGPVDDFNNLLQEFYYSSDRINDYRDLGDDITEVVSTVNAVVVSAQITEEHDATAFAPDLTPTYSIPRFGETAEFGNETYRQLGSTNGLTNGDAVQGAVRDGLLMIYGPQIPGPDQNNFSNSIPDYIWVLSDESYIPGEPYQGFPEIVRPPETGDNVVDFASIANATNTQLMTTTWRSGTNLNDIVTLPTLEQAQSIRDVYYRLGTAVEFIRYEVLGHEEFRGRDGNDRIDASSAEPIPWYLYGQEGNDTIIGSSSNDFLFLSTGENTLTGGLGADHFAAYEEEAPGTGLFDELFGTDTIKDFSREDGDKIDLSMWDAQPFQSGNQNFTLKPDGFTGQRGEVVLEIDPEIGTTWNVLIDTNGNGEANHRLIVEEVSELTLSDFVGVEGLISISMADQVANESSGFLEFNVELSDAFDTGILVLDLVQLYDGSMPAMNGGVALGDISEWSDFRTAETATRKITIQAGQTLSELVRVPIVDDPVIEPDSEIVFGLAINITESTAQLEQFDVTGQALPGSVLDPFSGDVFDLVYGTITDDDASGNDPLQTSRTNITFERNGFQVDQDLERYLENDLFAAAARVYEANSYVPDLEIELVYTIADIAGDSIAEADQVDSPVRLEIRSPINGGVGERFVPQALYEYVTNTNTADPDMRILIDPTKVPAWYSGAGGPNEASRQLPSYDMATVFTHEILHGLGVGTVSYPWDFHIQEETNDQGQGESYFLLTDESNEGTALVRTELDKKHLYFGTDSLITAGYGGPNETLSGIDVAVLETLGYRDGGPAWRVEEANSPEEIEATEEVEEFDLDSADGEETVRGNAEELDGDSLRNFDTSDKLVVENSAFSRKDVLVTFGSAILDIDSDQDGDFDTRVTLEGNYSDGDFMAVAFEDDTTITFENLLPELAEGKAVDPSFVNGVINQLFLTSNGGTQFEIDIVDLGFAGYDNVVGLYEIDEAGTLINARVLFDNANDPGEDAILVEGIDAGNTLGFFIVQDGADWLAGLGEADEFNFVNSAGAVATLDDGADIFLAINGTTTDQIVYHSYDADMNRDGVQHSLSGVAPGGESIILGFEDLTGGGDQDYEDVVLEIVRATDAFDFV